MMHLPPAITSLCLFCVNAAGRCIHDLMCFQIIAGVYQTAGPFYSNDKFSSPEPQEEKIIIIRYYHYYHLRKRAQPFGILQEEFGNASREIWKIIRLLSLESSVVIAKNKIGKKLANNAKNKISKKCKKTKSTKNAKNNISK